MHNMFWCVSWCFMYCKYIRLLPTTRPYMSISLYQSIPTFVLLSPIHTYIHLQSLTHRFLSFLQFPALSIRDQPAPEGSTTTMINLCQPSSPCQVLGSLGPWVLAFFSIMAAFFPWSSWVSTSDFGEHSAAILLRSTDASRIFATSHKKSSNVINM